VGKGRKGRKREIEEGRGRSLTRLNAREMSEGGGERGKGDEKCQEERLIKKGKRYRED